MGLIISNFKSKGHSFTNAYAKVNNAVVDNNLKIVTFNINVYSSKDDKNLITSITRQWCKPAVGEGVIEACYNSLATKVAIIKNDIDRKQSEVDNATSDNIKYRNQFLLEKLKENELLQFEDAINDDYVAPTESVVEENTVVDEPTVTE